MSPVATATPATANPPAEPALATPTGTATTVREIPLDGVDRDAANALGRRGLDDTAVLSPVVRSTGYAVAGITWSAGAALGEREFFLRTESDGSWSRWQPMEVDPAHAPDADSRESQRSLPGTEPFVVGDVDALQVTMTTTGSSRAVPDGLTLSVIDPDAAGAGTRVDGASGRTPDYPAQGGPER